jgi:predicted nucleic acid-binding protein
MKIFVDTNILLDILMRREPFYENAAFIWNLAESKKIEGYISAVSVTNIFYLCRKTVGVEQAKEIIKIILRVFRISKVDFEVLKMAEEYNMKDYEDSVQFVCALQSNCSILITRNKKDFPKEELEMMDTEEFARYMSGQSK